MIKKFLILTNEEEFHLNGLIAYKESENRKYNEKIEELEYRRNKNNREIKVLCDIKEKSIKEQIYGDD